MMKQYLKNFTDFSINENVEAKEYKVKDKHKAEDRLGELGIDWEEFIDHPDGTGFGTDGNLMAHYDEATGKLYVHIEPSGSKTYKISREDTDIPSDEEIDKHKDFDALLQRYNSETGTSDDDDDDWYKEDEDDDNNDDEPSDDDIANMSFDDF